MKPSALLWVSLGLLGCKPDKEEPTGGARGDEGHERGDCRADKTCDPGLLCLSNLCVRPPPADCQLVADQLASIELGNYAEMETRAPIVASYKAACEKAYVSKEEGACLSKARDRWSAAQCTPRMFPETASSGECGKVGDRVRALMAKQAVTTTDPKIRAMYDGAIAVVLQSCEEDQWPDALKSCVITSSENATDPMQQCTAQVPPGLKQKMQDRMMKLMQTIQR